jgi:hypothetical protein
LLLKVKQVEFTWCNLIALMMLSDQQTMNNKLMKSKIYMLACTAGLLSSSAFADFSAQEREVRVEMTMSRTSVEETDTTMVAGEVSYGYFITDGFEVLVGGVYGHTDNDSTTVTTYGLMTGVRYHFNNGSPWTPFVGAKLSYIDSELEDLSYDDLAYGAECGIRHRINENIVLDYALDYVRTKDVETDTIAFSLGLGFVF